MAADRVILVVEDNDQNLELVEFLLEEAGWQVIAARTAGEARTAWKSQPFTLVLMDMRLPDADGIDLVRELRSDPALRALPVIALTAHAMRGDRERFLAAGCSGYIAKPIRPATFLQEVEAFVSVIPKERP
jgi:two-component system cell cycle response regulator